MNNPFFSIIIPTRNRPQLLREALKSALLQNFNDFEVVVSINSDDEATQTVIDAFESNLRLSVFRTEADLSMPDHWEFATQKAKGRYILILTDRSVLKRHALKTIHGAISSNENVLACSWRWSLFDDVSKLELVNNPLIEEGKIFNLASWDIAQNFLAGKYRLPYMLPRGLNSCFRSDLASEIRAKHGALFAPISPDYTSAFLILAHSENVVFLDTALFISQGTSVSTGNGTTHSVAATHGYLNSLPAFDYYAHVPFKEAVVENLIFEDFLAIQEKAAGNLQDTKFDWPHYFVSCYREIMVKSSEKSDIFKGRSELLFSWKRALLSFDLVTQHEVKARVARIKKIRKIKDLIKVTPLGSLLLYINRMIQNRGKISKSALEHAGFGNAPD